MIAYFTKPDGQRYQAGDTLEEPAYAATLRDLAAKGPEALYEGPDWPGRSSTALHQERPGLRRHDPGGPRKAYKPQGRPSALCRPWKV